MANKYNIGVEDYKNRASTTTKDTSSTADYYQLARDQEYATLFDKEVALENAKQNAMKYTQNQVQASGFGGTGYGSSIQNGVINSYMNRLGQASTEYNQNIQQINQQEKEALETESATRTGNISSMLQSSTSVDQMNNLLSEYRYGTVENGTFKFNDVKPEGMSDDEWIQLKYMYNAQKDNMGDTSFTGSYFTDINSIKQAQLTEYKDDANENVVKLGDYYSGELDVLSSKIASGLVPYGSIVRLRNDRGSSVYVMYTKNGIRMASKEEYDKTSNNVFVYNRNTNSWTTKDKFSVN